MIKAVIFDMDGLIADTETLNSESWVKLLMARGIKPIFTKQGLIHEVGPVGDDSYKKIMERHGIRDKIETIRKIRRSFFEEIIKEKITPFPGFLELLNKFKQKKIKIGLASNRIEKHVHLILKTLGVKDFFDVILCRGVKIPAKPSPEIYFRIAKKLKLKSTECLVLEDSETGVTSAKNAGMKVIAVPNQYTKDQNFAKANLIVDSLKGVKWSTISNI